MGADVTQVLQSANAGVMEELESVGADVTQVLQSANADIRKELESVGVDIRQVLQSANAGVMEELESVGVDIIQVLESANVGVMEELESVCADVTQVLQSANAGVIEELKSVGADVTQVLKPANTGVTAGLESVGADVTQVLESAVVGVADRLYFADSKTAESSSGGDVNKISSLGSVLSKCSTSLTESLSFLLASHTTEMEPQVPLAEGCCAAAFSHSWLEVFLAEAGSSTLTTAAARPSTLCVCKTPAWLGTLASDPRCWTLFITGTCFCLRGVAPHSRGFSSV